MTRTRAHVIVEGRVQGVFFRDFTRRQAESRGLTGFVRNLPDGRVEVVLEGEEAAVKSLVEALGQGPPLAHVTRLEVTYGTPTGEFPDFSVRYGSRYG